MVMEIVPWLLGPAGIVLGWWLNQRTLVEGAKREAKRSDAADERQRVLDALRRGRETAGLVRSLLHGIYLKDQYGSPPDGLDALMSDFNRSKDDFRSSILYVRVLGPSWAVEGAERLDVEITKLAELAFNMQTGVKAEHMSSVNSDLPKLERMVNEYVTTVSCRYNAAPSDLPQHPNMETEGRWKPIDA